MLAIRADDPSARNELIVHPHAAKIKSRNFRAPQERNASAQARSTSSCEASSGAIRMPFPPGLLALAEEFSSEKRKPEKGKPRGRNRVRSRVLCSAATASGSNPSPQGLSMGGLRESITVTRRSCRRAAIAVAKPGRARRLPPATSGLHVPRTLNILPSQKDELRAKSRPHRRQNAQRPRLRPAVRVDVLQN